MIAPALLEDDGPLGAAFAAVKERVVQRTGHFYYVDKDKLLWERVKRRMQALKLRSIDAYLQHLDDAQTGDAEWTQLEAEITVGETFFFRYPEQFAALRDTVLPSLLREHAQEKRLRIWSAGCANGAEAYSVAILLHELLGAALPDWRITIVGTDINARAVAAARSGQFGNWALRAVTPEERARYFTPDGKGVWSLRPAYRALVRFEQQNLVTLLDNIPLQFTDFDLILCRNVLIYFHPETAVRLADVLGTCLAKKGWLFFGHAEATLALGSVLAPVQLPGTTAYRRSENAPDMVAAPMFAWPAPKEEAPLPWQPLSLPEVSHIPAHWLGDHAPAPAPAPERPLQSPAPDIDQIRARADVGDFDGALALCRSAAEAHGLSAQLHFYEGVLHHAEGRLAEAEEAFRRALYLNKHYPMAHYHLGLTLGDAGKADAAKRAIANAAAAAAQSADDAPLADGDGMTVRDLKRAARRQIDAMERMA
jgi:chemotaxis protein methyltransferase CheR